MEEDRWEALPGPSYARGFLDIYARHLGLDQQALLDDYRKTVEGERHDPIPQSVIKPGTLRQTRPVGRTHSINWGPVAKVAGGSDRPGRRRSRHRRVDRRIGQRRRQ